MRGRKSADTLDIDAGTNPLRELEADAEGQSPHP